MTTKSAEPSKATSGPGTGKAGAAGSRGPGPRLARVTVVALAALTVGLVVAGALVTFQIVWNNADARAHTHFADGRVPTSFGALWVDSFEEIAIPEMVHQGHVGIPKPGSPDRVGLEVRVRLANTTKAPVELTPARFALRLVGDGSPVSVEGASFESVRLIPGAVFDARIQFPMRGGQHQLSLLFDDPDGSGPIVIDLGLARFQYPGDDDHNDHEVSGQPD